MLCASSLVNNTLVKDATQASLRVAGACDADRALQAAGLGGQAA
jgi:hypothetical protein